MKIRIVSKIKKAFAITMSAQEACSNFAKVDEYHLRNQSSGFMIEHDNGYKEFATADEVAENWASNGKLSLPQIIELITENTIAERVDTGEKIQLTKHGLEVEKDGTFIPLCLIKDYLNAKYKIVKKDKK